MAKLLYDRGFHKVRPLKGGFDAWVEAGYPVDQGLEIASPDAASHG
ncbi:MAG TPA: hypothetical protein VLR94_12275 [Acidobacteriota bacterium]|nr:hypothetical protein [Acidobacteriota bacterium]